MSKAEILEKLQSGKSPAQREALQALQEQVASGSPLDETTIAALDTLLRDEKVFRTEKAQIVALLGTVNDDSVLETVRWVLDNITDFEVQKQAFEILEERFDGDEIDRLILIIKYHPQAQEKMKAIRAIAEYDDRRVLSTLKVTLLRNTNKTIRQTVGEMIIKIQGEDCVSLLTTAIIGEKLSHYWVTNHLRRNRIKFDGKEMMDRIQKEAPQSVLDEVEKVRQNMRDR